MIGKYKINYMDFSNVDELFSYLIDQVKSVHNDEYESVKLYGNAELMLKILKRVLSLDRYDFIKIGCISLYANWFDVNVLDEYSLEINENYELSIQSAWNDNVLFKDESKCSICMNYCNDDILINAMQNKTDIIVANFL